MKAWPFLTDAVVTIFKDGSTSMFLLQSFVIVFLVQMAKSNFSHIFRVAKHQGKLDTFKIREKSGIGDEIWEN